MKETVIEIDYILAEDNDGTSTKSSTASKRNNRAQVKLQPIKLREFSGNPKEWQQFWDGFSSAVHENDDVATINKFHYLVGLLKGEAAEALTGLPVVMSNYLEAISILKARYGQKQIIINSHMEALMKLPSCSDSTDVHGLRKLYDSIEANIRGLQSLGINSAQYGALLIPVLQQKLPSDLQVEISRKIGNEEWNLAILLDILKVELEARERCKNLAGYDGSTALSIKKKASKWIPTASALVNETQSGTVQCTFCKGRHKTNDCKVITNRTARMSILRKEGRCFICLRKGHLAFNCVSKNLCYNCNGRHHISLCQKGRQQTKPMKSQETESGTHREETTNCFVESKPSILLQTAQAEVYNPANPGRKIIARIIFDSGSHRSYITERLRNYLKLPAVAEEHVCLKTFGKSVGKSETLDVAQLVVQDTFKPEENKQPELISTLVVPYICSPVQRHEIAMTQKAFPHLDGLQISEDPDVDAGKDVDILIGCDESIKFFTGEVRTDEYQKGPTAMNTSLGWVLYGPGATIRDKQINGQSTETYLLKVECTSEDLDSQLNKFWDFETIGIRDKETVAESFEKNVSFTDGKYSVVLPFKENSPVLPDNFENSVNRLNSTLKRLKKTPDVDALIETKPNCEFTLLTKLETNGNLSTVIDVRNFSNYNKLLRVTALVMRFIDNLKAKVRGSEVTVNGSNDYEGIITVGDVDNTRKLWILEIQRYITSDKRYGDWEKNLGLFVDAEGIVRCKGRFRNSEMAYGEKYPAILPKDHDVTKLVVMDCHRGVLHGGVNDTLAEAEGIFAWPT
eukprot:gene685-10393_t